MWEIIRNLQIMKGSRSIWKPAFKYFKSTSYLEDISIYLFGNSFLALSGNIYLSTRSTLVPYVIEVDEAGNAKAINPAYQKNYEPKEEFLIYSLKEFVRNFRWISLDPVVQNSLYSKGNEFINWAYAREIKRNFLRRKFIKPYTRKVYKRCSNK